METLREVLLGLRPWIPRSLLDGRGWEGLLERVGELPAAAAAACGFELRLGEPEPAADFTVPVPPGPLERYHARTGGRAGPAPAAALAGRPLARDGGRGPRPAADWIEGVLLEYDIVEAEPGGRGDPAVYLRLALPVDRDALGFTPDRLAAALARAAGRTDDKRERRAVARAFDALPQGGAVLFGAVMPARKPRAIRLVADVAGSETIGFLDRLQWTGSRQAVAELLAGTEDVFFSRWLSFDLTADGMAPRLGFESYPRARREGPRDRRALLINWLRTDRVDWEPVVDRLVEMNLCLPAKARGLLTWPRLDRIYDERGIFRLYMGINHVKITIEGERMHAKAYAGLKFYPIDSISEQAVHDNSPAAC